MKYAIKTSLSQQKLLLMTSWLNLEKVIHLHSEKYAEVKTKETIYMKFRCLKT